jgi:hypothetical protein
MIYFLQSGDRVKIGYSRDPKKRIEAIARSSPHECKLTCLVAGEVVDERELHERFGAFRIHGEWFFLSPEIQSFIKDRESELEETLVSAPGPMDNEPWQKRAKLAGLTQKTIAKLLGLAENSVSRQLRGKFKGGVPRYITSFIFAWERLTPKARKELIEFVEKEREAMVAAAEKSYEEADQPKDD